MDSTRLYLKCTHCGHTFNIKKEDKGVGFVNCTWCNMMVDIDKSEELARKDWQ